MALYSFLRDLRSENAKHIEITASVKVTNFKWNPWSKVNTHQLRQRPCFFKGPFCISSSCTGKSGSLLQVGNVGSRRKVISYTVYLLCNTKSRHKWKLPTLLLFMLIPIRKISSARKRLQQRFLWIVVLVLWISLKNQNVKMHMERQINEIIIPSWVILVRML